MLKNADGQYVVKNYQREGSKNQNHIKFVHNLNSVTYAGVNHFIEVAKNCSSEVRIHQEPGVLTIKN